MPQAGALGLPLHPAHGLYPSLLFPGERVRVAELLSQLQWSHHPGRWTLLMQTAGKGVGTSLVLGFQADLSLGRGHEYWVGVCWRDRVLSPAEVLIFHSPSLPPPKKKKRRRWPVP